MSVEKVKAYFEQFGMREKVVELAQSSATVTLAAEAIGVEPARIAKTMSFKREESCLLVVTAGDTKIDNSKFKAQFHCKAKMLSAEEVASMVGHAVGGVCPFAIPEDIPVYLDVSLQRFTTVFPAAGSSNSMIELTCSQLEQYARGQWVDVCKEVEQTTK